MNLCLWLNGRLLHQYLWIGLDQSIEKCGVLFEVSFGYALIKPIQSAQIQTAEPLQITYVTGERHASLHSDVIRFGHDMNTMNTIQLCIPILKLVLYFRIVRYPSNLAHVFFFSRSSSCMRSIWDGPYAFEQGCHDGSDKRIHHKSIIKCFNQLWPTPLPLFSYVCLHIRHYCSAATSSVVVPNQQHRNWMLQPTLSSSMPSPTDKVAATIHLLGTSDSSRHTPHFLCIYNT